MKISRLATFALSATLAAACATERTGIEGRPAAVVILGDVAGMYHGDDRTLRAVVVDERGHELSEATVSWETPDPDIVELGPDGYFLALAPGTARIRARVDGATTPGVVGEVTVHIAPLTVQQVTIVNGPFAVTVADVRVPGVLVTGEGGRRVNGQSVVLSSDNPSVALVDAAGRVRGVAPGTTTIRASVGTVQGIATVTVTDAPVHFDLTAYDLKPIPVAIDSGWTQWDGEPWFVVIRADSGSLRLHGASPRRYELRLRIMEYRAVTVGGVRTLVPHLAQNFTDVGVVAHDARGDLLLQSEQIGGYTNRADPSNSGAVVTFRIPGDDRLVRLDHARRP